MQAQGEGVAFTPVNPLLLMGSEFVGLDIGDRHSHVGILGREGLESLGACVHTSCDACMIRTAPPHPPRAIEW